METEIAKESAGSYNIKTGRGGMVDVEFIVQYLQLAYGRDFPDIRSTNTIEALQAIKECGLIPAGGGRYPPERLYLPSPPGIPASHRS